MWSTRFPSSPFPSQIVVSRTCEHHIHTHTHTPSNRPRGARFLGNVLHGQETTRDSVAPNCVCDCVGAMAAACAEGRRDAIWINGLICAKPIMEPRARAFRSRQSSVFARENGVETVGRKGGGAVVSNKWRVRGAGRHILIENLLSRSPHPHRCLSCSVSVCGHWPGKSVCRSVAIATRDASPSNCLLLQLGNYKRREENKNEE